MRSSTNLSRSFWPWGYSSEYLLKGEIAHGGLPALVGGSINQILPSRMYLGGFIDDIKGCDLESQDYKDTPLNREGVVEELMLIEGRSYEVPEEQTSQDEDELLKEIPFEPFKLHLLTCFDQFVGWGHIRHKVELVRHGSAVQQIELDRIAQTPGFKIDHFRISLELFRSKFTGWFGFAPIADQRFVLDATTSAIELSIIAEGLRKKRDLPLVSKGVFNNLAIVFRNVFSFDLRADYLKSVDI